VPHVPEHGALASEDTVARRVERQLRSTAASSRAAALLIEVNGNVAQRLTGNERIRRLEKDTGKKFLFQAPGLSRSIPSSWSPAVRSKRSRHSAYR